jgi:hypothetical protein
MTLQRGPCALCGHDDDGCQACRHCARTNHPHPHRYEPCGCTALIDTEMNRAAPEESAGAARSTIQTLAGARWSRSWAGDFRRAVCVPTRVKSRRVEESLRQSLGLHGCRPNGPAPARCSHSPATPHADVPPVDGCFVPSASSPRPLPRRSRSQQQQLQQSGWSSGRTPLACAGETNATPVGGCPGSRRT